MADERIVEDIRAGTYAQPLSRLQVSWGATWALTGALSVLGAATVLNRVRRVPERESGVAREYRQVIEAHSH